MGVSAEAVDVMDKGEGDMDMKLFKEVSKVARDTMIDGNELILLYAREEGAHYETLVFRKKESAQAYDVVEHYKKTGELVVHPGRLGLHEVIRPVCLMVAEAKYGYRALPSIMEFNQTSEA